MLASKQALGAGHAFVNEKFPHLSLSLYTRAFAVEVMFGNVDHEDPNLAYTVCESLMKLTPELRGLPAQNIVLSGGSVMIPGFGLRLQQEIKDFIDKRPEFDQLKSIKKLVRVPESIYAPNSLAWIGASIMMSLSLGDEKIKESERFLVTSEQYDAEGKTIKDRFGNAYLTFNRNSVYFDKTFEINLRLAKYADVQSNFSNRTYETRKRSIATILRKNFTTPQNNY